MIRDPSDGSVREQPAKPKAPMTSGLPPIDPVDRVMKEREARSREWLKEYRNRQKTGSGNA